MKLLVYVPGLWSKPTTYTPLLERLRADLGPEWRVEVFDHGVRPWTVARLDDVAYRLAVRVRTWAGDNGIGEPAEEVRLVGHSMGGLLARHAYLVDAGAMKGPSHATYGWTSRVSRIVLLAAPNAGFRTERLAWPRRAGFVAGAALGHFAVEDLQHGSAYVTELRLRWVDHFRGGARPRVVQVLGDRDDYVTREDSLDVEFMPNATRIDVPGAEHGDLVRIADDEERYALLRRAIDGDLGGRPEAGAFVARPVYFLLHGIRAGKYANWVGRVANELTAAEPDAVVHAPSYGYLSAVEFAVPFTRSRNLRRFLDWYCRLYVTHGGEALRFAGHSNGTYLLGRALQAVPAMRFERVYLAGSVLPREYPWSAIEAREQVKRVHTDRAAADWPVGWLCSALRGLGMRDVGTGGFDGFDEATAIVEEHDLAFEGGHGAALETPERIAEVAAFLRVDDAGGSHAPRHEPTKPFAWVSRFAGVAARPAALAGAVCATRWVVRAATPAGRGRRLAALAAGGFGVVAVGRSV